MHMQTALEPISVDSADAICRHEGFSGAGSIRTSTLDAMGLSMAAIRVSTLEILESRSTKILLAVECLKMGQKACTADSNGIFGPGNRGKNNFGTKNVGNDNIEITTPTCQEASATTHPEVATASCQEVSSPTRQGVTAPTRQDATAPTCQEPTTFTASTTPLSPNPTTRATATVEFSAPKDGRVDITFIATTVGYTSSYVRPRVYSSNLSLLAGVIFSAGGLIGVGSEDYSSTPMTWTTTLLESQTALATYAPVVAYKTGSGTANALTLT
ncbi:hypothetical protein ACKKBF_B15685 [Auxenochlorella protothecoides x Auxenochlorella symbiontica]